MPNENAVGQLLGIALGTHPSGAELTRHAPRLTHWGPRLYDTPLGRLLVEFGPYSGAGFLSDPTVRALILAMPPSKRQKMARTLWRGWIGAVDQGHGGPLPFFGDAEVTRAALDGQPLERIPSASSRAIYAIGTSHVLKVDRGRPYQAPSEAALWNSVAPEDRPHLAPLAASGDRITIQKRLLKDPSLILELTPPNITEKLASIIAKYAIGKARLLFGTPTDPSAPGEDFLGLLGVNPDTGTVAIHDYGRYGQHPDPWAQIAAEDQTASA